MMDLGCCEEKVEAGWGGFCSCAMAAGLSSLISIILGTGEWIRGLSLDTLSGLFSMGSGLVKVISSAARSKR